MCKKDKHLILGLEGFLDKIGYQAYSYKDKNIDPYYLVCDSKGTSSVIADRYGANIRILSSRILRRVVRVFVETIKFRPDYVEVYHTGVLTALYVIFGKLFSKKVFLFLRGQEFEKKGLNYFSLRLSLLLTDIVICKEANLLSKAKEHCELNKIRFLGNAVPLPKYSNTKAFDEKAIDILYINSIRKMRNVDFLIDVFEVLIRRRPNLKISLIGFSNGYTFEKEYEEGIKNTLEDRGLVEKIHLENFAKDPAKYHMSAKLFVLPADVIYANYSLLEAMAYGCVPVVLNGEGADKIVDNGDSGIILDKNVESWVSSILTILDDEEACKKFSRRSRDKIRSDFSLESWVDKICEWK